METIKQFIKAILIVVILIALLEAGILFMGLAVWLGTASKALELICLTLSALSFCSFLAIIDRI